MKINEFGEEVIGRIKFFDVKGARIGLVIEDEDGNDTSLQLFFERDCESCQILDESCESTDSIDNASRIRGLSVEKVNVQEDCQDDIKVIKAHMTEEETRDVFKEVDPRVSGNFGHDLSRQRRDNPHLRNLVQIKLDKLLCGAPPPGEPEMLSLEKDKSGTSYYILPAVVQSSNPRVDGNNHEVHGGRAEMIIRDKLWTNTKTFPVIQTPHKMFIIEETGELFSRVVEILDGTSRVGLSGEGRSLGREGSLAWLVLATPEEVFLFDIISLGGDAFKYGLKTILENRMTIKVVHDSRFLADCLYHQYGVRIVNIYDTMVGDHVFCNQVCHDGFLPANFRSLPLLLRDYLGVEDDHIFYPRLRRTQLDQDSAVWEQRPSSDTLLLGAARNCLYLLPLSALVRKAHFLPFHHSVDILQRSIRDQDDPDSVRALANLRLLPPELPRVLPDWEQRSVQDPDTGARLTRHTRDPVTGQVVHPNTANPDPLCIFSRDSMHQSEG